LSSQVGKTHGASSRDALQWWQATLGYLRCPTSKEPLAIRAWALVSHRFKEQLCSDPGSDELLHDREKYLAGHSKLFKEMFSQFGFPAFAATPELFSHGPIGYEVRVPIG